MRKNMHWSYCEESKLGPSIQTHAIRRTVHHHAQELEEVGNTRKTESF